MSNQVIVTAAAAALLLGGCAAPARTAAPAAAPPAGPSAVSATSPQAEAHWAALPALGPLEVAFVHQRLADVPEAAEALASSLPGVCGVTDDAARQEALGAAFERVSLGIRVAASTPRWKLVLTTELGGYDFPNAAFPTGLTEASGPTYGRADFCWQPVELAVALQNAADFARLTVPGDRARAFVRGNQQRVVREELEVEVLGTRPGPPKALVVKIRRLRLVDAVTRNVLADSGL